MGRKSRMKRERNNQPVHMGKLAARSLLILMLDQGLEIETLLTHPVLLKQLEPTNILGIAQLWKDKTPEGRAQMVEMAIKVADLPFEQFLKSSPTA